MATFLAMLIASVAGWVVEGPVRALLGPAPSMAASLLVSAAAFFFTKKFISELRDGS